MLLKSRFIEMFGDVNNKRLDEYVELEQAFDIRDDLRQPINEITRLSMQDGELYPYFGANGQVGTINKYLFDCTVLCLAEDCGAYKKDESSSYIITGKAWVNNHAHVLIPKENCNVFYANYYFKVFDLSKLVSGSTRQKLTQSQLKKVNFYLPQLSLQNNFGDFLQQIDKSKFLLQQMIEKLELLKKSRFIELTKNLEYNYTLNELSVEWFKGQPLKKTDIVENGEHSCIHYGELFKYGYSIKNVISKTNIIPLKFSQVGDILFPASDVTPTGLARCSAIMNDNVILASDIIVLRPQKKLILYF